MPDLKITGLTADTSPTSDDLIPTVNDPAGTPSNRKVTLANAITKAHGLSDGAVVSVVSGNLSSTTITASVAELNYVDGVTSAIQTQLDGKQATLTNSAGLASALSDETGTGLAVFNNSPVFVDDITVGTAGVATGDILIKGATSGTVTLTVNDVAGTPTYVLPAAVGGAGTFLKDNAGDGVLSWDTPAGSGNVSKVGTPVNNQVGVWTGDGTIEGDTDLTFDGSLLTSGAVAVAGTAGAGYLDLVGQTVNPSSPSAGTIRVHGITTQGFSRLELDNEGTSDIVIPRDSVIVVRNSSGVTINRGEVVYISGATGSIPQITKAQANSLTTLPAVWVVLDTITNNSFGQAMRSGIVSDFDTSAFSVGAAVYVSTTVAGGLTATRPSGTTNFAQRVGTILVSNAVSGAMDVNVAPAILNMETGTNAATWTGSAIVGTTLTTSGNIELGHASDTTISRVSAGVVAIEGVNILTTAGGTLTGNITLGENTSIALDPAGSADGKWSGITVTGVSGYTQAFGDLVTLDKDDSRWEAVDISVAAAATGDARGILGMVVSAGTDGNACTILLSGIIRADANFPALTIGANVYASTAGDIVVTQPTTTDHVIRIVGSALTADEIFFRPDFLWFTHV